MPQIHTRLRKVAEECGYIISPQYLRIDGRIHANLTHPITGLTAKFSCGNSWDGSYHKIKDYEQTIRVCAEPDPDKRRFRGGKNWAENVSTDHVTPSSSGKKKSKTEKKKEKLAKKAEKYK